MCDAGSGRLIRKQTCVKEKVGPGYYWLMSLIFTEGWYMLKKPKGKIKPPFMEIKRLAHRKAVILFSADQTTTEIEFNLGKHKQWGIQEWTPDPRTGVCEQPWEAALEALGWLAWGRDTRGCRTLGRERQVREVWTRVTSIHRTRVPFQKSERGTWWNGLSKTRFQQTELSEPGDSGWMALIGAWSNTVWWNLLQYGSVRLNTSHSLKAES